MATSYNEVLPRVVVTEDGDSYVKDQKYRRKGKITKYELSTAKNAMAAGTTQQRPVQTLAFAKAKEEALVCRCGSQRLRYIGDGVLECMECSELKEF